MVTGVGSSERADPARGVSFTAAERERVNRRPKESLQALLERGLGLEAEDA